MVRWLICFACFAVGCSSPGSKNAFDPCPGHVNDAENIALATATHAAMVMRSRMPDRGIKRARFVVIRDITIPGVLVEGGFLSNDYDARLIATPTYRQLAAAALIGWCSTSLFNSHFSTFVEGRLVFFWLGAMLATQTSARTT